MGTQTLSTQDLLEIQYEKRKYLYVVDEKRMKEFMKATEEFNSVKSAMNKENINPFEWMGLGLNLLSAQANVMGSAGDLHSVDGVLTWSDIFKSEEEKKFTFTAVKNYISGAIFPGDGIPLTETTYICNPISKRHYYVAKDFYREMLEFKKNEAKILLRSLGATEINIVEKEETNNNFDFGLNLFGDIFSMNNNGSKNYNYHSREHHEYDPSDTQPFIPEDLYSINYEPQWRTIANQRIHNKGLKSFEIEVNISDDIGINSEINALIKGIKFAANGKYDGSRKISFSLSGKFS